MPKYTKPGSKPPVFQILADKHHSLSPNKAKEILRHGSVRGKALSKKQKRFMAAKAY